MAEYDAARRIACLQPSATEILYALGQLDRIVACTKYCAAVVPQISQARVTIQDSWTADAQEIISVEPDLVIAAVPYQEKALGEILRGGVRVLALAPHSLSDIYGDIATIANLVGAVEAGASLIATMRGRIAGVRQRCAKLRRKKVFCEEWGKPLIASQPWVAELVEAAGGEFLGEPGKQVTAEEVMRRGPDVLIAAWCGAGNRVPLEKIIKQRGWEAMPAVRDRAVYCIPDEYLNTPSPSLLRGLDALASCLHPGEFAQIEGVRRLSGEPALASATASQL